MVRWEGKTERENRTICVVTDRSVGLEAITKIVPAVPATTSITSWNLPQAAITKILPFLIILLSIFSLSGCNSYGSSFSCKDARGIDCMPLSLVDQKINSGEIAEVELKARAKCKGRNCYAGSLEEKPEIKSGVTHRVKLQDELNQNDREVKDGDVLYIQ